MTPENAKTPAQNASFSSIKYVQAQNKEKWLALFAEDAVLEDPVGVSPLDPEGKGHQGHKAIAAFWDLAITSGKIEFQLIASHPCANECANVARLKKWLSDDIVITTDLVVVYTVNDSGLIISLKAYWEYEVVAKQLEAAFS